MSVQLFLIDGGLANTETRSRTAVVEMMADDLVEFDAYAVEADAVRALMFCGRYTTLEVMHYLPDARQVAMQEIVAREMAEPCGRNGGNCQCTCKAECIHHAD